MTGELAAILTAGCWAVSSEIFTRAVVRLGAVAVNAARLWGGALLLALVVAARGLPMPHDARQLALLVASAVVGLVLGDSFLFKAYELIGARKSTLVMALAPVLAAVLAYAFLGERLTATAAVGGAMILAGIAMVVRERGGDEMAVPWGDRRALEGLAHAFLGALGQGANLVLAKQAFVIAPLDGVTAALVRIAGAAVLLTVPIAVSGQLGRMARALVADRRTLALVGGGTILGPFLGMTLSLVAIAHTSVAVAATLMATVPIMMLPVSRLSDATALSPRAVSGAVVGVLGVALLFLA